MLTKIYFMKINSICQDKTKVKKSRNLYFFVNLGFYFPNKFRNISNNSSKIYNSNLNKDRLISKINRS